MIDYGVRASDAKIEKIWVTPREAAVLLSVSPRTLWQWTKDQFIPSYKIGRLIRYCRDEIEAWAKAQRQAYNGQPVS